MKKIAFIGMDALGSAMAIRLLHAGYQVTVYNKRKYIYRIRRYFF